MMGDDDAADTAGGRDGVETDGGREQGVDIGSLADDLESHTYPATREELVAAYGGHEIGLFDGTVSFEEVMERLVGDAETFESASEVRRTVYGMVDARAVGREGYTDRGGIASENSTARGSEADDGESL